MKQAPLVAHIKLANVTEFWTNAFLDSNHIYSIHFNKQSCKKYNFYEGFVHEILCTRNFELLHFSSLTLTRCVLDTNSTNSYGPSQKSVHRLLNLSHIDKQVELSLTSFPLSVVRFREVSPVGISLKLFILRRPFPNFEPYILYIAFKEQLTLTDLRKIVKPLRTV